MTSNSGLLPAPTKERWDGTADTHEPGEDDSSQSVITAEFKGSKWFTNDEVSLKRQDGQRPGRHQTWVHIWQEKETLNQQSEE